MSLSYIQEDGQVLTLRDALLRHPLEARGVLSDALFHCNQEVLLDTLDYVRAEQAIRAALFAFNADQDRWVKTYILTRILESRVGQSKRADLVHLAFHLGGPIVLAGVYHATNDAHRNPRNRATLEFLLRVPQGTLEELFGRANRFPCNAMMEGWLRRIMAKLPLDARDLACLMIALGVPVLPQCLFARAREPTATWGSNGEVSPVATSVTLMVRNQERFGEALRALESVRLVTVTPQSIEVNSRFKELLGDWGQDAKWKAEAVRLVCHAFPKSAIIEPDYAVVGRLLLPPLRHVISYFDEVSVQSTHMLVVVESYLSASYFADRAWKEKVLRIADGLVPAASIDDEIRPLLQVRLQLRQTSLTRLYGVAGAGEPGFTVAATDERTNGYFASEVTLRVQACLESGLLASARSMLSRYSPGRFGRLSAFEAAQKQEMALLEGIICRLEGQFAAALPLLTGCMRHHWLESRCVVHLAAVECELGQSSSAIDRLDAFISTAASKPRPRLALANAHLSRLLTALRDKKPYMHMVPASKGLFTALAEIGGGQTENRTLLLDRVNISMALAVLEHIAGNLDSASAAWQRALGDSKRHHASPGYTDMVIAYSSYELETRRGDPAEASLLEAKARLLFASTGRQYYMTSLGTIWPDIVGGWLEASGRERVVR